MAVSVEQPHHQTAEQLRCASCDEPLVGPFCPGCGQRAFAGRHTLRAIVLHPVAATLQVDRGFLHTAVRLTVTPGRVVRDYIAGRMASYTHPGAYLLVSFAAFAVLASWRGAAGDLRFFFLPAVLFITVVSRLIFWRARFSVAEHAIMGMYLFGHWALLAALLMAVGSVVSVPLPPLLPASVRQLLFGEWLGAAYFAWGYSRCFNRRPILSALGGVAVFLIGYALWLTAFIIVALVMGS